MLFDRLEKQSGLSATQIERFAQTASVRYKVFTIPKKSGGLRTIEQPSRAIKGLQRWIMRAYITKLPIHPSATAYLKGSSIRRNAERHQGTNFTLRIDFSDFFPSFKFNHVQAFLEAASVIAPISDRDRWLIASIVCRNGGLTIGAPSSPGLTNAMMFDFDNKLNEWADAQNIIYSRYADDIFLSCHRPGILTQALQYVTTISRDYRYASLAINSTKTRFLSKKYRRTVTGLVLTPNGGISVGRKRKDDIKSLLYRLEKNRISFAEVASLKGNIAFVRDVDPDFYRRIAVKYAQAMRLLDSETELGTNVTQSG